MPWEAHEVPNAGRSLMEIEQDETRPGIIPDEVLNGDAHLWVCNTAYYMHPDEVLRALAEDGEPPHLTPDRVISVRVACGKCLAQADHPDLLVFNEPCPGEVPR